MPTRPLTPEEELVLLAAATHARRVERAERAAELAARVDWGKLQADLEYQRLLPLLGGRLAELDAPASFVAAVRRETDVARELGQLLELVTLQVATALESAGVPNVPLKGPLLARALHGDAGMRASRDLDVLVARADFATAVEALRSLGWRVDPGGETPLHATLTRPDALPDIELHWRVHWYESDFAAQALARAQLGPDGVRRFTAPDDLVALMLYHARDGFAGLRHPVDLGAWWDAHGTTTGEPLLQPAVRVHPDLRRALTASAVLLDALTGIPSDRLLLTTSLDWAPRQALTLANPFMRGEPEQITAEVSLVDGLLAPPGQRRAFVRRRLLAKPRDLPPHSKNQPIAVARAEHAARLLRRYAIAVARSPARGEVFHASGVASSRRIDQ